MELGSERKLHRAAIAVYVLKSMRDAALPLVIIVFFSAFGGGFDAQGLARGAVYGAIGVAIAAVTGWWRWDTTRWWVTTDGIHRRSGLISTKQTDVPFTRVQALDLEQGPIQRWFNVHSVHVQTGGGGAQGEIVLEAIWDDELEWLRSLVAAPSVPEEREAIPERRLTPASLLLAALTAGQIGVILPLLAGAAQLAQNVAGDDAERDAVQLIPHSTGGWLVAAAVLVAAAWLLSVIGSLVAFARFRIMRDGDRLRIRRGLLEQRETTIPVARIRAVVVVEGPLRRPFRLAALRMEVIGHAKEPTAAQALYPLLRRAEVRPFLDAFLPELADDLDGLTPLPRRALRRYVLPPALAGLVIGAAGWPLIGPWGLLAALPAAAWGMLGFGAAGWRLQDGHLAARRLGFARTTVLARAADGESHTLAQDVFQRRADLADLEVAFGKRTTARVHHLDAGLARDAFGRLTAGPSATVP
jgi:putative membrane protein